MNLNHIDPHAIFSFYIFLSSIKDKNKNKSYSLRLVLPRCAGMWSYMEDGRSPGAHTPEENSPAAAKVSTALSPSASLLPGLISCAGNSSCSEFRVRWPHYVQKTLF